jgi:hypothetical protein
MWPTFIGYKKYRNESSASLFHTLLLGHLILTWKLGSRPYLLRPTEEGMVKHSRIYLEVNLIRQLAQA